uniref:Uncharacterized protein n=1 Tax=Arion vulgaris TaxID=1028688 RepID=A0A0B6ZY06_9EUPU
MREYTEPVREFIRVKEKEHTESMREREYRANKRDIDTYVCIHRTTLCVIQIPDGTHNFSAKLKMCVYCTPYICSVFIL